MMESGSSVSARLPWILLIFMLIGFGFLYWNQANIDKMNQYRIRLLVEKVATQEDTINQLAESSSASPTAAVSAKDPLGSLNGIRSEITVTKNSIQEIKFKLQGLQNDYDARLAGMQSLNSSISDANARMSAIESEITGLKQLIGQ